MPYIEIRIEFEKEYDKKFDETWFIPRAVQQVKTDLSDGDIDIIGETARQSNFYQGDVGSAMLLALGEKGEVKI